MSNLGLKKKCKGAPLNSTEEKATAYSYFIWSLAAFFFIYEFFLRVLPATEATNIMKSAHLSIEQFALISSGYYIAYSIMQIPVGMLLDRLNPRLLITVACALCAVGATLFSYAENFTVAFVSRVMIGVGSAFGFVALMVVTLIWFPRRYFAFMIGCGQFLGSVGPLVAGTPVALLVKSAGGDWRIVFLGVALFGILLTVLIGLCLRNKTVDKSEVIYIDRQVPLRKRMNALIRKPQVWAILSFGATIYVALPLLGAFWGTTYLQARGFSRPTAAFMISMIWVGLAVGCPLFGTISDRLKRRKPTLYLCAIVGVVSTLFLIWTPSKNEVLLSALFFLVGIAGAGQNLSFALMSEQVDQSLRGTALGVNNTAIMGFAALLPPIITRVVQSFAEGGELTEAAFEKGLLVMPLCFAVSFFIILFCVKETFCREQSVIHRI